MLIAGELFLSYRTICGYSSIAALYSDVHGCFCKTVTLQLFSSPSPVSCLADLGDEAALSMGIMLWAGILVLIFVLLLLAVDVTCYYVNKCGLIMCLCGKSGTGTKGHNLEEGKAAFMWVLVTTITCSSTIFQTVTLGQIKMKVQLHCRTLCILFSQTGNMP